MILKIITKKDLTTNKVYWDIKLHPEKFSCP